jgi:hypothetical protein
MAIFSVCNVTPPSSANLGLKMKRIIGRATPRKLPETPLLPRFAQLPLPPSRYRRNWRKNLPVNKKIFAPNPSTFFDV